LVPDDIVHKYKHGTDDRIILLLLLLSSLGAMRCIFMEHVYPLRHFICHLICHAVRWSV